MTFTEAAAEVLRLVGKPLHYKDITDLAIEKNLLSHVGKSPEITMGSRLAALLKKGPKENPLVRVKPGVFALRAWQETGGVAPVVAAVETESAPPVAEKNERHEKADKTDKPEKIERAEKGERGEKGESKPPRSQRPGTIREPAAATVSPAQVPNVAVAKSENPALDEVSPAARVIEAEVRAPGEASVAGQGDSAPGPSGDPSHAGRGGSSLTGRDDTLHAEQSGGDAVDGDDAVTRPITPVAPKASGDTPHVRTQVATPIPGGVTPGPSASPRAPSAPSGGAAAHGRGGRHETPVNVPHAARGPRPGKTSTPDVLGVGGTQPRAADELLRAGLAANALDVFSEEDDDDKPILGAEPEVGPGRRRRRRRRRGADGAPAVMDSPGEGLPSYTVSPAFGEDGAAPVARESSDANDGDTEGDAEGTPAAPALVARRDDRGDRPDRGNRQDRGDRGDRGDRPDRGEPRADRGERTDEPGRERRDERAPKLAEGEEPIGRDVAEIVVQILSSFDRNAGPVPMRSVTEAAIRRGKLLGDAAFVQAQISAAARADNLRRESAGLRPRFRCSGGRMALTDWALGTELIRLEAEALAAVDRYREAARRVLARKVGELPGQGFVELIVLMLETLGISQLRAVRRPGVSPGETHLTGVQKSAGGEQRLAIVIRRDGREIGRERVADLRGSLHHYGTATQAWLITAGQVLSGAREEASVPNAPPVALLDGLAIAKTCEEHGIAAVRTHLTIAVADLDFLEGLRAQGNA